MTALVATLAACGTTGTPDSDEAASTDADTARIVVGETSVIDEVDPMSVAWDLTAAGVSEGAFMVDDEGELYSRFVSDVTPDGDLDWTITLIGEAKFSDGTDVDAEAFAWALNEIQENNPLSNASAGVIEFTADGDDVKARTERQTVVLDSVLAEWTNVIYKEGDEGEFIFTGPFAVEDLQPGTQLDLVPNEHYPDAEGRSNVSIKAFPDVDAMRLAIQEGSIDMAFTVTPEVAKQLEDQDGITVKSIDAGYQYLALLNLEGTDLEDPDVREALDLGLDRQMYIDALGGGSIANGLFAHYYSFAGDIELNYDNDAAARLLDEAGWETGDGGIRSKDGKQLTLSLVTYSSRPDLSTIMEIMVSQLKDLGIGAETRVVDDIRAELEEQDWDVALYAQHTAPTGEPSFFLNQFFRTGEANNFTGYSSEETDAALDALGKLPAGSERDDQARIVQELIAKDRPALFLVDPQWHIAVTQRLSDYQPYGGDYYVINPELRVS